MKTIIAILVVLSSVFWHYSAAQINVGSKLIVGPKPGKFKDGDIEALKKTKTIFVYRAHDEKNLDVFKSTLDSVWNISDIEFASYDEFISNKYEGNYSFMMLQVVLKVKVSDDRTYSSSHVFLTLSTKINDKSRTFCRIELRPNSGVNRKAMEYSGSKDGLLMKYLYSTAVLKNWNLGYLKNALQLVSSNLESGTNRWLHKSESDKRITVLQNDTLYIPKNTFTNPYNWNKTEDKEDVSVKLLKGYHRPYKILPTAELSNLIVNSKLPIYYLTFIVSGSDKYITVTNSITGEILYSIYEGLKLRSSDFGRLARKVK
jgi:hypothetical protein